MDRKLLASAVGKIAWAYVLLHLDVKVMGLDLLPSWGAWLLILSALRPLAAVVPSAALLRTPAIVLAVWSAICWLPLGLSDGGWPVQLVGLVMQILAIYCHFQLLTDLAGGPPSAGPADRVHRAADPLRPAVRVGGLAPGAGPAAGPGQRRRGRLDLRRPVRAAR